MKTCLWATKSWSLRPKKSMFKSKKGSVPVCLEQQYSVSWWIPVPFFHLTPLMEPSRHVVMSISRTFTKMRGRMVILGGQKVDRGLGEKCWNTICLLRNSPLLLWTTHIIAGELKPCSWASDQNLELNSLMQCQVLDNQSPEWFRTAIGLQSGILCISAAISLVQSGSSMVPDWAAHHGLSCDWPTGMLMRSFQPRPNYGSIKNSQLIHWIAQLVIVFYFLVYLQVA